MLLKRFRVVICKRGHLVMQVAAGVKPVGQTAVRTFENFDQMIRLQLHGPRKVRTTIKSLPISTV